MTADTTSPVAPASLSAPRLALVAGERPSRLPRRVRRWTTPLLLLLVWELLVRIDVLPQALVAPPSQLPTTFIELIASGDLQAGVLASALRAFAGLLLGTALAVLSAVAAGLSRIGEDAVDPIVQLLRPLPATALTTLAVLILGIGENTKIALLAFAVFFPVYLNTLHGITNTDRRLVEVAAVNGFNRSRLIRRVVLPSALPSFFVGFRFSTSVSWLMLVVVEQINAKSGLGYMLAEAQRYFRTDIIMAILIVYALLGLLTDALVVWVSRRATPWRSEGIR